MLLALASFAVVVRAAGGVWAQAREPGHENAFLTFLFPLRDGNSPSMLVPERGVTGAIAG